MSNPDRILGARGRAGARLRGPRQMSPGRPVEQQLSDATLSERGNSPTRTVVPPLRGRSSDRAGLEGNRGAIRGQRSGVVDTITRPTHLITKEGKQGKFIPLLANYFILWKATAWSLRQYRVDFKPDLDNAKVRNAMLRQHADQLGSYTFDKGNLMYTSNKLASDPLILKCIDQKDVSKVFTITISYRADLEPGDVANVMFYNTTLRRCLFNMKLLEMGRAFYDCKDEKLLPQQRLKLWPGFKTSIRNHENNVLLGVETTHKVLRMDNVLTTIDEIRNDRNLRGDPNQACCDAVVGSIVLTSYNNKTYKVSDINWNLTPDSTFTLKNGETTTYANYYEQRYSLRVTSMKQPLLLTTPTKKDFHRGSNKDDGPDSVYLVPELCQMTGLTDKMRDNFSLMKELAKYLHEGPAGKIQTLLQFIKRLRDVPENKEYLEKWGLEFKDTLLSCNGRVLDPEGIIFAGGQPEPIDAAKADWTMAFRKRKMLTCVDLKNWVIIVTKRDSGEVNNLVNTMIRVASPIGFNLSKPEIIGVDDTRVNTFINSITNQSKKPGIQLMFIILPTNNVSTYGAIKKKLSSDIGLPSQCFLAKNLRNKGLMSVCTKVVIQMNAKLGGEPWTVKIPLKKMMTVGFDVYHGGKVTGGKNVGALVASISPTHAKFFSTVSFFTSTDEMSRNMCTDLIKSIEAYHTLNAELPERILFYRDGVGDGQLEVLISTELDQVKKALEAIYVKNDLPMPRLTFVVVSKKIQTRLFKQGRTDYENPPPGTVCDNQVTLPERYDFFLIPQTARQGAVSPTSFNILYDTQNLDADKIQKLTFKMCHLYFNWSGTVAVPAVCQYAHKFANQTGIAIGASSHQKLNYLLHFL